MKIVIGKLSTTWRSKEGKPWMNGQARVGFVIKDGEGWYSKFVPPGDSSLLWIEGQEIDVILGENSKGYKEWNHADAPKKTPTKWKPTSTGNRTSTVINDKTAFVPEIFVADKIQPVWAVEMEKRIIRAIKSSVVPFEDIP